MNTRRVIRREGGFSLFGVLLGLGLAAVVIVGSVGLYNKSREATNRSETLSLVTQLRANVESVFLNYPSYGTGSLIPALEARDLIPDKARKSATEIVHPYGGTVTITGVTDNFTMAFATLDLGACVSLGDAYAGRSTGRAGLIALNIDGNVMALPATGATVVAACDNDSVNTVTFTFR